MQCRSCDTEFPTEEGVHRLLAGHSDASHHAFYSEANDPVRFGRDKSGMPDAWVRQVQNFVDAVPADALLVEIGAGRGAFRRIHPGYVATDYSFPALAADGDGARVQADAQQLPFADESIDALFSVSTLEHVPDPERALEEVDRCLKPGGQALLFPAWYVRPWASKALAVRSFGDLPLPDKLRKATIPVRDARPFQLGKVLPGRISREIRVARGNRIPFSYWKLRPNMREYLVADSDAFSSMDPHAMSTYFVSRGYADRQRPSGGSRLLYQYDPVWVVKGGRPA
jgi:SAM-dependent methyltransferase